MKLEKHIINNYTMGVYRTDKFSTIHLLFLFEIDYREKLTFKLDLLEEYMMYSLEKYKTRKEIGNKVASLYSPFYTISDTTKGDKIFIKVTFECYDPKLIHADYLEEALKFFGEVLFRPNFTGGKLDPEELKRTKNTLIEKTGERLLDSEEKSYISFTKFMYPNSFKTRDLIETKEEYASILNSIEDEELIKIHKEIFTSSLVGALLMGNIEEEYFKYIEQIFKFKHTKELDYNFNEKVKIPKEPLYMEEIDKEASDSTLRVVYTTPYKSLKERISYNVIVRMMNKSGSILRKVLRDEMKLVYACFAHFDYIQKNLTLVAYIDKDNKDRALEGFNKVLEILSSKELIQKLLDKIKEENEMSLYIYDEDKSNYLNEMVDRMFKLSITDKLYYRVIKSLTSDDIINALNKLKLIKIHFYRGEK